MIKNEIKTPVVVLENIDLYNVKINIRTENLNRIEKFNNNLNNKNLKEITKGSRIGKGISLVGRQRREPGRVKVIPPIETFIISKINYLTIYQDNFPCIKCANCVDTNDKLFMYNYTYTCNSFLRKNKLLAY